MHRSIYIVIIFLIGTSGHLVGQCKDKSVWEKAWISCEMTSSPNPLRGNTHWLRYDLGYDYQLTSVQIWNHNKEESLDMGAKEVVIDYSNDGISWSEAGVFEVSKAEGTDYYSGEVIGDLQGLQTRYLLLTFRDNWGHPSCTSVDEVSFRLKQAPLPKEESLWLFPNPARDHATLSFQSQAGEELEIRLLNLIGQNISSYRHTAVEGKQSLRLELADVRPGVYVVQILNSEDEILGAKKLVVVNR